MVDKLQSLPSFLSLPSVVVDIASQYGDYELARGIVCNTESECDPVLWRFQVPSDSFSYSYAHWDVDQLLVRRRHHFDIYRRVPSSVDNGHTWELAELRLERRQSTWKTKIHRDWVLQIHDIGANLFYFAYLISTYKINGALKKEFTFNFPQLFEFYRLYFAMNSSDEIVISCLGAEKGDPKEKETDRPGGTGLPSVLYVWIFTTDGILLEHFKKNAADVLIENPPVISLDNPSSSSSSSVLRATSSSSSVLRATSSSSTAVFFFNPIAIDTQCNFYIIKGRVIYKLSKFGNLVSIIQLQSNVNRAAFPAFNEQFDAWVRQHLLIAKTGEYIVRCIAGSNRMRNHQFHTYIFNPNGVYEREIVVREPNFVASTFISNMGHLIVHTLSDVTCYC